MKKTIIIIGGILFILALIGIWVYLFIFGTPESIEETIQNFPTSSGESTFVSDGLNFEDRPDPEENHSIEQVEVNQLNISQSALNQLTTNPVAGFSILNSENILYVEAGTGHLFKVDISTGVQTRLSNNTFPQTRKAIFSPDNSVILFFANNQMRIAILDTENNLRIGQPIIAPKNVKIDVDNNILHTVSSDRSTSGFSTNTSTGETETIFTIPLKDPIIVWGETINSRHFAYPRPAAGLHGRLFEIRNNTLRFTPVAGTNLTVTRINNDFLITSRTASNTTTNIWEGGSNVSVKNFLQHPVYSEKCTKILQLLLCAKNESSAISINDWYKGVVSFNDNLWAFDISQENAKEIINLEQASGRRIDIDMITSNSDGTKILFRNKIDGNMWLFNNLEPLTTPPLDETTEED